MRGHVHDILKSLKAQHSSSDQAALVGACSHANCKLWHVPACLLGRASTWPHALVNSRTWRRVRMALARVRTQEKATLVLTSRRSASPAGAPFPHSQLPSALTTAPSSTRQAGPGAPGAGKPYPSHRSMMPWPTVRGAGRQGQCTTRMLQESPHHQPRPPRDQGHLIRRQFAYCPSSWRQAICRKPGALCQCMRGLARHRKAERQASFDDACLVHREITWPYWHY